MDYRVGICGITGRVGLELSILLQDGFVSRGDTLKLSDAISGTRGTEQINGVHVRTIEDPSSANVDVWIDFSQPAATMKLLEKIQTPLVIGTTGFSDGESARIREYAKKQSVLLSSNMSPGMNLVLSMLQSVPIPKDLGFDVFVSETHHAQKKDSPSGTALTVVEALKKTGQTDIQVQSTRAGNVKGVHTISFIGEDEEFSVEHRVFNRSVFARGALLAAHFILGQGPGLYSMADLWNDKEVEP